MARHINAIILNIKAKVPGKHSSEVQINPLYTGKLFHGYMLDDSICYFRGVGYTLSF